MSRRWLDSLMWLPIEMPEPIVCADNDDVDDNGNGVSAELGCIACKSTTQTYLSRTARYTIALRCDDCGEILTEVRA